MGAAPEVWVIRSPDGTGRLACDGDAGAVMLFAPDAVATKFADAGRALAKAVREALSSDFGPIANCRDALQAYDRATKAGG